MGTKREGCMIPRCDNLHRAQGFCTRHYRMALRSGEIIAVPPKRKLTEEDIAQIKMLLAAGDLKQKEIAAQYGVSCAMVSKINTKVSHDGGDTGPSNYRYGSINVVPIKQQMARNEDGR
jgi:hypothetical protein